MAYLVAPFTGAWIEIGKNPLRMILIAVSLPSRGRGLKFDQKCLPFSPLLSLPSRGRGLK